MLYKVLLTIIHPSKSSLLGVGALGMLYSTLFTHGDRGLPTTALILANIRLRTTVSKCARSREIYKVIDPDSFITQFISLSNYPSQ